MNEKHNRRLERNALVYFPEVFNNDTGESVGRIIDVTVEGFLIVGEKPIEPDTHFNAKVTWVDESKNETSFTCIIHVAWCKPDVNPDYKAIGCKIDEISVENKESIKRLIRKWSFPSW